MVTVTLTFDRLISKSLGIIYTLDKCLFQIWRTYVNSESIYHPDKVWSIYQHVEGLCDLDLWQIDLKINRDHLHSNTNVCTKFDEPRSILCLVIIWTRFGLYINMWTVTVTLIFDLKINRDHLHSKTYVCAKPRSLLCLVIFHTRKGLQTGGQTDWHEQNNVPPLCWRGA